MKFTGHERDLADPSGTGDDLDYMHARHCSPLTARFLSPDPDARSVSLSRPQTWNRYTYVTNNPLAFVDPSGAILRFTGDPKLFRIVQRILNRALDGYKVSIDEDGVVSITAKRGAGSEELATFLSNVIDSEETTTISLSVGSDTLVGDFATGDVDLADVRQFPSEAPGGQSGVLAFEISEQYLKQVEGVTSHSDAHFKSIEALSEIEHYTRSPNDQVLDLGAEGAVLYFTYVQGGKIVNLRAQVDGKNISEVKRIVQ